MKIASPPRFSLGGSRANLVCKFVEHLIPSLQFHIARDANAFLHVPDTTTCVSFVLCESAEYN